MGRLRWTRPGREATARWWPSCSPLVRMAPHTPLPRLALSPVSPGRPRDTDSSGGQNRSGFTSVDMLGAYLVILDVVCVLTGDWMCPVNKGEDKKKKDVNKEEEEGSEPKGDPEMAPIYLKRLLPVFAQTFQQTMLPSIR